MADNRIYDIDGYEFMTDAIGTILNNFPGLSGDSITFSTLGEDGGVAWYPVSGAVVKSVRAGTYIDGDVTGHVDATCSYPFYLIYRSAPRSESQKIRIKEWLDTLGKWLERKEVMINGYTYQLDEYPKVSDRRTILNIMRQSPAYLETISPDGVEDWAIYLNLDYRDEFDR